MKKILKTAGIVLLILFVLFCAVMVIFGDRIPYVADFILIDRWMAL